MRYDSIYDTILIRVKEALVKISYEGVAEALHWSDIAVWCIENGHSDITKHEVYEVAREYIEYLYELEVIK